MKEGKSITFFKEVAERKVRFSPQVVEQRNEYDYLAPDTSEIRVLLTEKNAFGGSMVHCTLPPGKTSIAVKHKTVEELWYFINGCGEIWLKHETMEEIKSVKKGIAVSIPPGTVFQFRNLSEHEPLEIIMTTMPPWPGKEEAIQLEGKWQPSAQANIKAEL